MLRNDGLTKTLNAGASAIAANRIVRMSAIGAAETATAATDRLVGVSDLGADAGERIDVLMSGIVAVKLGGTIAPGDLITTDATGRAVATTTANNRVIGVAMQAGVADDIGSILISPGIV